MDTRKLKEKDHRGIVPINQEDVSVGINMMPDMLLLNSSFEYALIDFRATHSFVARKIIR